MAPAGNTTARTVGSPKSEGLLEVHERDTPSESSRTASVPATTAMRRYTWTALVLVAGAALGSALVWWGRSSVPVGEGSQASSTARNESLSAVPAPTSENESAAVPIPTPATPTRANPIDKYAERIREAQTA